MTYAEIRHDYISGPAFEWGIHSAEDDLFARVSIDAWETDDDDEEGQVLAAVIMTKHGDLYVEYHDNGCRMNEQVLEAIDASKTQLRELWAERHPDPKPGTPLTKEEQTQLTALLKKQCRNEMAQGKCQADGCENCHIQAILDQVKEEAQERLNLYVQRIIELTRSLDTFEFMDRVDDPSEFANEVRSYLADGDLTPIRGWLEDIKDDEGGNAAHLTALLDAFEKGEPFQN